MTDLRVLIGSVCYWEGSSLKGQHTAGSLFCFFPVTEVVWEAFKRGLSLLQVRATAKPTTWPEKVWGRWQGQISRRPGQTGSLWFHGPEHQQESRLCSHHKERSSCVWEVGRWTRCISWAISVWNKLSLTRLEKQLLHMNQQGPFQPFVLRVWYPSPVKNKTKSVLVFHLPVQIFNINLSLRDPIELKMVAVDSKEF